jgi:hypothetical protein
MNLKQVLLTVTAVSSGLSAAGCQTSELTSTRTGSSAFTISAKSGHKTGLLSNYMVNPDCSSGKVPDFKVAAAPANGTVDLWRGAVSPSFAQGHTLQKCNVRKIAAVGAFYTSKSGFVGTDKVVVSSKAPGSDVYSYVTVHINVAK